MDKILRLFPEEIDRMASMPDVEYLIQVREELEAKMLEEERAIAFRHVVVQLLFLIGHTMRDIQMVVAFLTTRVKLLDEDNWGKLKWVM